MNKGVFLDRDGVINEVLTERVKFVNNPNQFYLLDHVGEAIKLFNDLHFLVFVVTNQGGVGLGYMKESSLQKIHEKMKLDLAIYGAKITDIIYCPHKPHAGCECRKPQPSMITQLAEQYEVSLPDSYMIGDRDIDIVAGKNAGTKTILIGGNDQGEAEHHFQTLYDAAKWIYHQAKKEADQ